MNKLFTEQAWNDYLYWIETDKKQVKRINTLIREIDRSPKEGIGKPEPLKANLSGYWSRRIDSEHRIVYAIEKDKIVYISFRFHYDNK
ncbi:MAG: Txe/YoeB family addiction module toxin [Planctomycetaceae bacterium]|jgi:toxin YoeB|nr:Txe/YoeB family addiction module toxin [Planctomycetaceae bacterium]